MTKVLSGLSLILLVLSLGTAAMADTVTDTNVQFTATVTGTTATLQIQCISAVACGSWYIGDVTLKGFTLNGFTPGTAPSGYTLNNGGQNNDAVAATNGGCNGTQSGKAICWDAPTTLDTLGAGLNTFTANITNGLSSGTLHVQATFYDNSAGVGTGGHKVLAVSDDLAGSSGSTPEPASMILLGTGLLTLGSFARRRANKV